MHEMTAGKVTLATAGVVIALAWWQAGIKKSKEVRHDQNPQL
jgi:hypothetical protein